MMVNTTVRALMADMENLWAGLDEVFASFGLADWARPHGPLWTMADVPFHLSYFDRDVIAHALDRGPDMPESDRALIGCFADIDAWNAMKFGDRPAGLSPQAATEAMQASRETIRGLTSQMSDEDLERPAWLPVFGGWLNAGVALTVLTGHTWNHHTELRLRLDRTGPQPSASATHRALGFYNMLIPHATLDREAASGREYATVMDFTGPGGGAWTINVAGGGCACSEGRAANPDIVLTQSPESFVKLLTGMHAAPDAIAAGAITVEGKENLETYAMLFLDIDPKRPVPAMGAMSL